MLCASWVKGSDANDVIRIDESFTKKIYISNFFVCQDADGRYSFRDVVAQSFQHFFVRPESSSPSFGFDRMTVWVKFIVKNESHNVRRLMFVCENENLDEIIMYDNSRIGDFREIHRNRVVADSTVDYFNYRDFEVSLLPDQTVCFYFKIKNENTNLSCPFSLYDYDEYRRHFKLMQFHLGFFYGLIMLSLVVSLVFYFVQRRRIALLYSIFLMSCYVFFLHEDGLLNKLLLANISWWSDSLSFIPVLAPVVTMLLTAQTLTYKSPYVKLMNRVIYSLVAAMVFLPLLLVIFGCRPYLLVAYLALGGLSTMLVFCWLIVREDRNGFNVGLSVTMLILTIVVLAYVLGWYGHIAISTSVEIVRLGFVLHLLVLIYGLSSLFHLSIHHFADYEVQELEKLNKMKDEINSELEVKVKERTDELARLNADLVNANAQLSKERDAFETQNMLANRQSRELTDSIVYAQRIQRSFVSVKDKLPTMFNDYFILDQPRDIVGGDFYWINEIDNKILIAIADSTGHGVPGAFMSIIGATFLNEIVVYNKLSKPNEILNTLRDKIVHAFSNTSESLTAKDGMDVSLIAIDKDAKRLEFAGAYNPLIIVRDNQLFTIKGDKIPISVGDRQDEPFSNNEFELHEGDSLYMLTDGFTDQFGWRTGKKFGINQFKELLLDVNDLPLEARKVIIYNSLKNWRGDLEQTDDIMVFGLRV